MKGQASIEFMSLLILMLTASAVLLSDLEDKAVVYQNDKDFEEAEMIALKTNYKLSYVNTHRNSSVSLNYPTNLNNEYAITVNNTGTYVSTDFNQMQFSSRYGGDNSFTFNTTDDYRLTYDGGVKIE